MPEGRVAGWRWMLRASDARRDHRPTEPPRSPALKIKKPAHWGTFHWIALVMTVLGGDALRDYFFTDYQPGWQWIVATIFGSWTAAVLAGALKQERSEASRTIHGDA